MTIHAIICSFHDCSGSAVLPNGKTAYWDFSKEFGPLFTDASGHELDPQPGTRTYAWKAFWAWLHELKGDRLCDQCGGTGRGAAISPEEFRAKRLGRQPHPGRDFWACKGGCDEGWILGPGL